MTFPDQESGVTAGVTGVYSHMLSELFICILMFQRSERTPRKPHLGNILIIMLKNTHKVFC